MDYMTYDRYDFFKPRIMMYQPTHNSANRVTDINQVGTGKCGDCLRGNFVFCSDTKAFGSAFTGSANKPAGQCCEDSAACASDTSIPSSYNCSSGYSDDYLQYQICPVDTSVCGAKKVLVEQEGIDHTRVINGLDKGEVCNFRIEAGCGAPVFKVEFQNNKDKLNITWVEFENTTDMANITIGTHPDNNNMPKAS